MDIYVQFFDASKQVIISFFSCSQDPGEFPNQDVIDSTDPRYVAYYNSLSASFRPSLPSPT